MIIIVDVVHYHFDFTFQNPYAPDSDPCLVVENYARTYEQNDALGLNDMKTENYA